MLGSNIVKIALCCIPTLTPLFTYFREKSTTAGRYGYKSGAYAGDHNNSHSMNILKSQPRSRITETSSDRWKDRDSDDNSSQKGIIGLDSAIAGHAQDMERKRGLTKGITATTKVEVKVEDVSRENTANVRW